MTVTKAVPSTSATTEPLAPATTVRAPWTMKTAETLPAAVTDLAGSAQSLVAVPSAQASSPDSVQRSKRCSLAAVAVSTAADRTLKAKPCEGSRRPSPWRRR